MKARLSAALCLLLILGALPATGRQAPELNPQRMWALIIGISDYARAEPLQYAASDARALSKFVKSPRGGGIPEDHVFTLLEDQASRYNLLVRLEELQSLVQPEDIVYIYIAGHGHLTNQGLGYFIPADGDLKVPAATAISFSVLKELVELGLAHASRRVLVTDLCNAGRIGPEKSELAETIQNLINRELLDLKNAGGTFLNLLASRPTEASWERDDLGRGVFTHVLLEGLNGAALSGQNPIVEAKQIVDYIISEVPKYTADQQHPMVNDDYDPDLPLSYLDLPGPDLTVAPETFLVISSPEQPLIRIEWVDTRTQARAVQAVSSGEQIQIRGLEAGTSLELRLFTDESEFFTRQVNLSQGRNTLNLSAARHPSGWLPQIASAAAPAWFMLSRFLTPVLQQQSTAAEEAPPQDESAILLMRLNEGTQVHMDGAYLGTGTAQQVLMQIQGLQPGTHQLRLVLSPEWERRYRLELFSGAQVFDWVSGELQKLESLRPHPDRLPLPPGLPESLEESYRSLRRRLWQERLVGAPAPSAFEVYQQIVEDLPPVLADDTARELAIAMGNRAQRTILKYLRGGDIRWSAETFEEGASLLSAVQSLFQSTPEIRSDQHFFQGRALIERGDYAAAVQQLRDSIALNPNASHAHNALGLAYWQQSRLAEAIPLLEEAIRLSPEWTYPRNTLSLIHVEQRRYTEAETGFQTTIQLDEEDSTSHHGLGQLYFLVGRWEEAEARLQLALQANPGNAYAHETLGRLYIRQQRFQEAEAMLRLAVRLEPQEPSFYMSLGELFQQQGRAAEAAPFYADALSREPDNPHVLQGYAAFLAGTGKAGEAESLHRRALRAAREDAAVHVRYGLFLQGQGEAGDAREQFRQAARVDPESPYGHYNLAALEASRAELEEAEESLARAMEADPRYPLPYLLLGKIRAAQDRPREALQNLQRALDLSIEAHQQQEIREEISRARESLLSREIQEARVLMDRNRPQEALQILLSLAQEAPAHFELRNAFLQFQQHFPARLNPSDLPPSPLRSVLETSFWMQQREAERLWQQGQQESALGSFKAALAGLSLAERRIVGGTDFNLRNREFGVHQIIYTWAARLLDRGAYEEALELMELSTGYMLFAPVPNFRPLTVDSLAIPADAENPQQFSDFEVLHHPDSRAHEIYAAAYAGLRQPIETTRYLEAIETHGYDLKARLRIARVLERENKLSLAAEILTLVLQNVEDGRFPDHLLQETRQLLSDLRRRLRQ